MTENPQNIPADDAGVVIPDERTEAAGAIAADGYDPTDDVEEPAEVEPVEDTEPVQLEEDPDAEVSEPAEDHAPDEADLEGVEISGGDEPEAA